MSREAYALLTGLFVLVLGSALVAIAAWLGRYGDERDRYIVTTQGSVSGLNTESTVIYRGVEAGKVVAIAFDPTDPRTILVRIEVQKGLPITTATYARLRIQGLTGLAQIELNDPGDKQPPLITSEKNPARIPLRPSLVDHLSNSGSNILLQADELIARLLEVLDKDNRERLQHILTNLESATGQFARLEERMDRAFAEVPDFSNKAKKTLTHIDEVAVNLEKLARKMQTFANSAEALADSGKKTGDALISTTLPRVNALLDDLQSTSTQIRRLSGQLQRNPQGLLFGPQDPEPGPGEPGYRGPR